MSKYFNFNMGRARWLVDNGCLPQPIKSHADINGRISRIWNEKDLRDFKEFSKLSVGEVIALALQYKKENKELKRKLKEK